MTGSPMVGDLIGMNVYSFVCVASPVLWRIVRVSIASVVILQWSAALAADTGSQNIWGKGNDFSNAQGGVSQPALPVSGKVPKTAAWKAICDAHFRDFESRNRDERERIQARFRTQVERDREWARWVADRDGQSRACAETWPGTYDLARASGNVAGPRRCFWNCGRRVMQKRAGRRAACLQRRRAVDRLEYARGQSSGRDSCGRHLRGRRAGNSGFATV
jgi:hypothetical protein